MKVSASLNIASGSDHMSHVECACTTVTWHNTSFGSSGVWNDKALVVATRLMGTC